MAVGRHCPCRYQLLCTVGRHIGLRSTVRSTVPIGARFEARRRLAPSLGTAAGKQTRAHLHTCFARCNIKRTGPTPAAALGGGGAGAGGESLCSPDSYTEACASSGEIGDLLNDGTATEADTAAEAAVVGPAPATVTLTTAEPANG